MIDDLEFAVRMISVPFNSGHLLSDRYRDGGTLFKTIINTFVVYPCVYGAYTKLCSACSPAITIKQSGDWVVPWGRPHPLRLDLEDFRLSEAEEGKGHAAKFWEWSEEQVEPYV